MASVTPAPSSAPRLALPKLSRLMRHKAGVAGAVILLVLTVLALGAGVVTDADPRAISLGARLQPPLTTDRAGDFHLLGTDALGRDVFARMLHGARVSLLVAISSVAISLVLGVTIGLVAGYYQGWLDAMLMRFVEAQLAFPFILLALTVLAALGAGLPQLILVLGVGRWDVFARVVRGEARSLMERQHIEACRALGVGGWRVMMRHLLPNLVNTVIVIASFSVATNILTESALSYLGLGVDVSIPTWGSMLAEGRDYMRSGWWLTALPGAAIMVTVLAINAVGDWLRDLLDPRMVE